MLKVLKNHRYSSFLLNFSDFCRAWRWAVLFLSGMLQDVRNFINHRWMQWIWVMYSLWFWSLLGKMMDNFSVVLGPDYFYAASALVNGFECGVAASCEIPYGCVVIFLSSLSGAGSVRKRSMRCIFLVLGDYCRIFLYWGGVWHNLFCWEIWFLWVDVGCRWL